MKVQTEITYEQLAKALNLARGLTIDVVEVEAARGALNIVVSGDLPSRTVNANGFSPSPKRPGSFADYVHLAYLIEPKED